MPLKIRLLDSAPAVKVHMDQSSISTLYMQTGQHASIFSLSPAWGKISPEFMNFESIERNHIRSDLKSDVQRFCYDHFLNCKLGVGFWSLKKRTNQNKIPTKKPAPGMTERSDGKAVAAFHLSKLIIFSKWISGWGRKTLDIATACLEAISSSSESRHCIAACTQNDGTPAWACPR